MALPQDKVPAGGPQRRRSHPKSSASTTVRPTIKTVAFPIHITFENMLLAIEIFCFRDCKTTPR